MDMGTTWDMGIYLEDLDMGYGYRRDKDHDIRDIFGQRMTKLFPFVNYFVLAGWVWTPLSILQLDPMPSPESPCPNKGFMKLGMPL